MNMMNVADYIATSFSCSVPNEMTGCVCVSCELFVWLNEIEVEIRAKERKKMCVAGDDGEWWTKNM